MCSKFKGIYQNYIGLNVQHSPISQSMTCNISDQDDTDPTVQDETDENGGWGVSNTGFHIAPATQNVLSWPLQQFLGKYSLVSNVYTKEILPGKIWFANDMSKYWWIGKQEMTLQPLTQMSLHTLVCLLSYLSLSKDDK